MSGLWTDRDTAWVDGNAAWGPTTGSAATTGLAATFRTAAALGAAASGGPADLAAMSLTVFGPTTSSRSIAIPSRAGAATTVFPLGAPPSVKAGAACAGGEMRPHPARGVDAVLASAGTVRAACLVRQEAFLSGLREVLRLASPLTTTLSLGSALCTSLRLSSPIETEQTT